MYIQKTASLKPTWELPTSPSTTILNMRLRDRTWWYCKEHFYGSEAILFRKLHTKLLVILNEIASFSSENDQPFEM